VETPSRSNALPLIRNVQALRGVAALLVLVMHVLDTQVPVHSNDRALAIAGKVGLAFGHAGVDLFFVISGFIILTVAMGEAARADAAINPRLAASFAIRRVARIYPLFWVTTLVVLLLSGGWAVVAARPFALILVQLPGGFNPVAWTLVFEVYFYAVVAIALLLFARHLVVALIAWVLVQVEIVVAGCPGILGISLIFEFVFGCAIALLAARAPLLPPRLVASIGAAWFLPVFIVGIVYGPPVVPINLRLFWYGIPAALVLYAAVMAEKTQGKILPRWLQACGTWSYSLYLWHVPVILLIVDLGKLLGIERAIPGLLWAVMSAAASIWVSRWSYRLIERPIMDLVHSKRFLAPDAEKAPPAEASGADRTTRNFRGVG
jgi:exopolysaccharide production protein ExoZ